MPSTTPSPLQTAVTAWLGAHPETSQGTLAARAGLDSGDMSRIVKGSKHSLNMESAARLAAAMGVTVEALLAGQHESAAAPTIRVIPILELQPSPHNPRRDYDRAEIEGLAASIREHGLLQPLVVQPAPGAAGGYEVIAGHRRLEALILNGAPAAPCLVRAELDPAIARALQIIENLQRVDIKPMEEAQAFVDLQDQDPARYTAAEIGRLIGKSDRFVAQRIALVRNLDPELQEKVASGDLKIEVARTLATAPRKLQKVVAKDTWAMRDAEAVRSKLQQKAIPLAAAAFKVELYDGDWLEEGDMKWFADVAKFTRLQTKAAEAKVERLQKKWPTAAFVKTSDTNAYVWGDDGNYINTHWSGKAEAKTLAEGLTAADTTALVFLQTHTIKVVKNVVKRETWHAKATPPSERAQDGDSNRLEDNGGESDWQAAHTAKLDTVRPLNEALTAGLTSRPDLAKRLVIYGFLAVFAGFQADIDPRPMLTDLPAPLPTLFEDSPYFMPFEASVDGVDALWDVLRGLDEAVVDTLLGRLIAEGLHLNAWAKADGLTRALAAELKIEISPALLPQPETEVEAPADDGETDSGDDA